MVFFVAVAVAFVISEFAATYAVECLGKSRDIVNWLPFAVIMVLIPLGKLEWAKIRARGTAAVIVATVVLGLVSFGVSALRDQVVSTACRPSLSRAHE